MDIRKILAIMAFIFPMIITGCVDEEEYDNTPQGTFEALWKIIDERYCFFDYKKQEYGLDWNNVYNKYKVRVSNQMNSEQLFEVMSQMLGELRDGHVNLSTSYDFGRYWKWHEDYPLNFSDTLQRRYLGTDYRIAAGMRYKILDDNIGYVYYGSFSDGIGEGNIDEVLKSILKEAAPGKSYHYSYEEELNMACIWATPASAQNQTERSEPNK